TLVVDRVERTVEDRIELDEVRGRDLRHPGRGHELEVQPLVLEESLVAGHQHGQVVDRVHDGDLRFGRMALDIHDRSSLSYLAFAVYAVRVAFTWRHCAAGRSTGQSASIPAIAGHGIGRSGRRPSKRARGLPKGAKRPVPSALPTTRGSVVRITA